MSIYIVSKGDCLSSIAADHGFADWRTIYNDPANADFRKRRPNPNLIFAGDELFIPEKKVKSESVDTGKLITILVVLARTNLRLQLNDLGGRPLNNCSYVLTVGDLEFSQSSPDGKIDHEIPPNASEGHLVVTPDGDDPTKTFECDLLIGQLDPLEELSGIQGRLQNLGLLPEGVSGMIDDATVAALRSFQQAAGLDPSGSLDDATRAAIGRKHDGAQQA